VSIHNNLIKKTNKNKEMVAILYNLYNEYKEYLVDDILIDFFDLYKTCLKSIKALSNNNVLELIDEYKNKIINSISDIIVFLETNIGFLFYETYCELKDVLEILKKK